MYTLQPVVPGQPSLTLARLAVGLGEVTAADAKVIVAVGDDKTKTPVAFGQYDQNEFLYVVGRLFPAALNDNTVASLLSKLAGNPKTARLATSPAKITAAEIVKLVNSVLAVACQLIAGAAVTEHNMPEIISPTEPAGTARVGGLELDESGRLRLWLESTATGGGQFAGRLDEIT